MKLPLSKSPEFLSATGEFDHKAVAQAYSIDSRTIQPGELFFAVKASAWMGTTRVAALAKNAVDAVVRRDQSSTIPASPGCWRWTTRWSPCSTWGRGSATVGKSADWSYRIQPGKTTTKEAIAHVLAYVFDAEV